MFNKTRLKFDDIFENRLEEDKVRDYLIQLHNDGETAEQIAGAAVAMREHMIPLVVQQSLQEKLIDNCGTGGDKSDSFNISTTVSILLSACGSIVAKHGNRSITSKSGSADMLEALGVNLKLDIEQQIYMLKNCGFTFLFAVNHHPAMKYIMPIRKSIEHRTIFNILGPLSNPAQASKYLLGVFDKSFIDPIAKALLELDTKRAFVVSSHDGMDEIGISSNSSFAYVESGLMSKGEVNPQELGFTLAPKEAILGGDAQTNAQITRDILSGVEQGAKRDIVLLNSSFALFADGSVRDLQEGLDMSREFLESAKAIKHLELMAEISHKLA